MNEKKLRIIPKHRDIDFERLADALLDLVDTLSPQTKAELGMRGAELRKQIETDLKQKGGSAA